MSHTTTLTRGALERAYDREQDADVKLRMLLIQKVKYDGLGQNQAARELHAQSSWAVAWVRRFEEEGIEGLRTRPRSGRPPLVEQRLMARIGREVITNKSGWTTKEVRELVRKEAGVTYSERHILRLIHRWGARAIVPEKRLAHKASLEERLAFKKRTPGSSGPSPKGSRW
jgi:putative transposase